MQADAPVVHGQEGDRQHQRDGDAHHQARPDVERIPLQPAALGVAVQAQAQKTDQQHDDHGFDEHLHELVDRTRHGAGLVLHLQELHPGWQVTLDAGGRFFQCLAHGDDVAALGHGDPEGNAFLGLVTHLHLRRVHIGQLHVRNVRQAQLRARWGTHRHGAKLFDRTERTAHPHLHDVLR